MSLDTAMKFISNAAADPVLKEKVKAASTSVEALLGVAKNAGFEFSQEDYQKAVQTLEEMRLRGEAPLADDDLDMIAGGTGTTQMTTTTCKGCLGH